MPTTNASALRRTSRERRRALSTTEQEHHALELAHRISELHSFRNSKRIAAYLANDGEIDPRAIIARSRKLRKRIYLPVLSPLQQKLYFAPADRGVLLTPNRFGIDEPACSPRQWLRAWELDAILMPLVAFDEAGNRLGMGGGFYDRSLAFTRLRRHWHRPHLIGLAHECQKVDAMQTNHWDIPLDAVVTEAGVYRW